MVETITIASSTNQVTLSPGARVRRRLDTSEGYRVRPIPNRVHPKVRDVIMMKDTIEIQTNFKGRRSDYELLFNTMVRDRLQGATFTLTLGRKTGSDEVFSVIPHPAIIMEREAGLDELDSLTLSFLVVDAVD